ncbi:MAG: TetR/AcrR family transcriptional regulator [Mycobacterium sp.]
MGVSSYLLRSTPGAVANDVGHSERRENTNATHRRRADACANVNKIVAAAREVFAERGESATLTQVAERAGVGNATLYRHFANRQSLAAAVYEDIFLTEVEPVLRSLVDDDAPRESFLDVIERMVEVMHTQRRLLPSLDQFADLTARLFTSDPDLAGEMIRRRQENGELRPDLTVDDVPTFVAMVTTASVALDQPPALRRRYLSLMLDALNPAGAQPLPPV